MRQLLLAAILAVGITEEGAAKDANGPPFHFDNHGISVVIHRGTNVALNGHTVQIDVPVTLHCGGPAECMITVQEVFRTSHAAMCASVDSRRAHPDFCSSCFQ